MAESDRNEASERLMNELGRTTKARKRVRFDGWLSCGMHDVLSHYWALRCVNPFIPAFLFWSFHSLSGFLVLLEGRR